MQYFGEFKQMGKKSQKRHAKIKAVLHGEVFYYRKKKKLPNEFVSESGLDDEGIRNAVIKSIFQNYGIHITCYGNPAPYKQPKQPAATPPSPVLPDQAKGQQEPAIVRLSDPVGVSTVALDNDTEEAEDADE